jgi:CheY-like chemotaxis protein
MTRAPLVAVLARSSTVAMRLRLLLEAEGARVVVVEDADALLAQGRPNLVVADKQSVPTVRLGGVPVIAFLDDWAALRHEIGTALRGAGRSVEESGHLAAALGRARVLVVDDSQTYREFLRLELTHYGATAHTCASAADALARVAGEAWDAVLVDLVMPGIDGVELCGRLALLRRERGLDFVLAVLSSREGKDDLVRSLEAGADAFLGKSTDSAIMRVRLGALLRRKFLFPIGALP